MGIAVGLSSETVARVIHAQLLVTPHSTAGRNRQMLARAKVDSRLLLHGGYSRVSVVNRVKEGRF